MFQKLVSYDQQENTVHLSRKNSVLLKNENTKKIKNIIDDINKNNPERQVKNILRNTGTCTNLKNLQKH